MVIGNSSGISLPINTSLKLFQVIITNPDIHYSKFIAAADSKEARNIVSARLKSNEKIFKINEIKTATSSDGEYITALHGPVAQPG